MNNDCQQHQQQADSSETAATLTEYKRESSVDKPDLDPLWQRCKACRHRDKFNFHVPDDIWEAVVPRHLRNRVVCLSCFDEFARQRRVDYAPYLHTLYFAGDRGGFTFEVVSATTVEPWMLE